MSVIIVVVETEKPADMCDLGIAENIVRVVMGDEFGGLKWSHAMLCDKKQADDLRKELGHARSARIGSGIR